MAKIIEADFPGKWYVLPAYKVMLVREGSTRESGVRGITSPSMVVVTLQRFMDGLDREEVVALLLDRKHNVIGINTVSIGSLAGSIIHPREVFKPAIILGAGSIILAHNHPSGDPTPSGEDITVTKRLKECGELLGISLMDHIIIGDNGRYWSFMEEGMMKGDPES